MRWVLAVICALAVWGCKSTSELTGDGGGDSAGASCGNGMLDDGETCDGDCGTCDDSNACTTDTALGTAETCDLTCGRTVITSCASGDGCCPAGCDHASDTDCSATCGDGTIDANETCDPPGSCPSTCSDSNACTTDLMTGSPANCNVACSTSALTTCTDGDGCCPGTCTYATDKDCAPPSATTLDQRLTTVDITAADPVMAGDSNWRIWAMVSLLVAPVFTVPYADCGTLVGYTTKSGDDAPHARVARLNAQDQLVTTYDLGTFVMRGLAAEADGHFGALLWEKKTTASTNQMHVRRYTSAGVQVFSTPIANNQVAPDDMNIGESRLEYGNGKYGAYFHVHGVDPTYFAYGHEGDQYQTTDATTGTATNVWTWGCSHSTSELLRYSPAANLTLPVCVTDCYPGTNPGDPPDFSTTSIGGIYLNNSERKVREFDGNCGGKVAAELGGAAPGAAGWKLVFNGHQNAATLGQSSYDTATMNQDIGFQAIASDKKLSGSIVWLTTTTTIDEANASIARWLPMGDATEQYVVGWTSASTGGTYYLSRVSATGAFLEGPTAITTAKWGRRDDPFRTHTNGDIVWAWFDNAGSTTLRFARLDSGGTATCASL
jgi:hypothetical protein